MAIIEGPTYSNHSEDHVQRAPLIDGCPSLRVTAFHASGFGAQAQNDGPWTGSAGKGAFKIGSGTVQWSRSSYGTDFDNSEIASSVGPFTSTPPLPFMTPQIPCTETGRRHRGKWRGLGRLLLLILWRSRQIGGWGREILEGMWLWARHPRLVRAPSVRAVV